MNLLDYTYHLIRTLRPRQWLKNGAIAIPLVFSGFLFDGTDKLTRIIEAIIIFCFISSSIYLFNDVIDRNQDRKHPFKKFRAIAMGVITPSQAIFYSMLLATTGLILAFKLSPYYFLMAFLYILLQISYSTYLKNIAILDVFAIAAGFIMRAYAGGFVINVHMSVWLTLCVISSAMLIAVGKRRAEITILAKRPNSESPRAVLLKYPIEVLNSYVTMFANTAFLSWTLYTFFAESPSINLQFPELFSLLPKTLAGHNKWLMSTIPVVIYGIMRYLKIIYDGAQAESPERIILTDKPLLIAAFIWGFMIISIIYIIPAN